MDETEMKKLLREGVQPIKETLERLEAFVNWRLKVYQGRKWVGLTLSDAYGQDFQNFQTDDFEKLDRDLMRDLRDHLRSHGVYVKKERFYKISQALAETVQKELPWPEDDDEAPLQQPTTNSKPQSSSAQNINAPHAHERPDSEHTSNLIRQDAMAIAEQNLAQSHGPRFLPTPESLIEKFEHKNKHGYRKEMMDLAKMYTTDDLKYGGMTTESLNFKFTIFMDLCERAELPPDSLYLAFPSMLKGAALEFYYSSCYGLGFVTVTDLVQRFRTHFEGEEHRRSLLREWNATNLRTSFRQNPEKKRGQIFNDMVSRLRQIQRGLDTEFQTDSALRNKIIAACSDIPACSFVIVNPHNSATALINSIYSSIENSEEIAMAEKLDPLASVYYVDRKYHSNRFNSNRSQSSDNRQSGRKKCFICQKQGCWSTKHSEKERKDARAKFVNRFAGKKKYEAYLQEYEGKESSSDSGDEDMEALTLDIDKFDNLDLGNEVNENFNISVTQIPAGQAKLHYTLLMDQSTRYALTQSTPSVENFLVSSRYDSKRFHGIMLDTGAAHASTAGYGQAQAYSKQFGTKIDQKHNQVQAHFGIGKTVSIGTILVESPIGKITFQVVRANTPFLLCLQDMDKLGIYFNNLKDLIVRKDESTFPVIRIFEHPFLVWGPESINYLTEIELRQLHRRFGHPSVDRLVKTLERADYQDPGNRRIIDRITKYCKLCQKHSKSPGRFKFNLKDEDDAYFNHALIMDVFYIDGSPILHVVDEGTSFQAAKWLANLSAAHIWDMLRLCWIDVYSGPPEIVVHDAGTNFDSSEFRQSASSMSIQVKRVPVEAPQSIGLVERYHAPLRRAYAIITEELKNRPSTKELRLQMAVKAINDSAGYNGLIPTLLVFGTFPRISNDDSPTLSTTERAKAIKLAMAELAKERAKRKVSDALSQRNGPQTSKIHDTPIGADVLIWRVHQKKWVGPFKLLSTQAETCTVDTPNGPTNFRTTIVKPYLTLDDNERDENLDIDSTRNQYDPENPGAELDMSRRNPLEDEMDNQNLPRRNPCRNRQLPARFQDLADITINTNMIKPSPDFRNSRLKELTGLLERGVFEIVSMKDVPEGTRVFGSRFVDQIKHEGTSKAYEKSRLVIQAHSDTGKRDILTQAPTIQRMSQRIILAMCRMLGLEIHLRDITQAYTQSVSKLLRDIFVRPPKEMNLPPQSLLKIILPLYGIPESGTHWFCTYHKHHTSKLGMISSTFDSCLLYNTDITALIGLQTDDSLIAATESFMQREDAELKAAGLIAKPFEKLAVETPLDFNGFRIEMKVDNSIEITQVSQIRKIESIAESSFTRDQYVAQRARGAYIATVTQPQAAFALSYAAQITDPTLQDIRFLNRCLAWQQKGEGLRFVKLDIKSLRIITFTDSSFANNKDHSSQIGYVIIFADDDNNANLIHWQSVKCRRVTRSVLASELYALSLGFDIATTIKSTVDHILGIKVPLTLCIDSKSLYECLVKLGTTREKRLMVDIQCLRQAYERREIAEILWIKGDKNPADAMTKEKGCDALQKLIDTNQVELVLDGWVERKSA